MKNVEQEQTGKQAHGAQGASGQSPAGTSKAEKSALEEKKGASTREPEGTEFVVGDGAVILKDCELKLPGNQIASLKEGDLITDAGTLSLCIAQKVEMRKASEEEVKDGVAVKEDREKTVAELKEAAATGGVGAPVSGGEVGVLGNVDEITEEAAKLKEKEEEEKKAAAAATGEEKEDAPSSRR
jgi:hypothetical protein